MAQRIGHSKMQFADDLEALTSFSRPVVSVQYEDRSWEVALQPESNMLSEVSSIALDLQAALNLSTPPVGLRLRGATDTDAVVCPLSMLAACPSYIATKFQGMSWVPIMKQDDEGSTEAKDDESNMPPLPTQLGSPIGELEISPLEHCGSTASPSEGWGRPLTAPSGDQGRGIMLRQRPSRREGLGRPLSATPSDKSRGMHRIRPAKSEGFTRPSTALLSANSSFSSPHGFRCDETSEEIRPFTAPVLETRFLRQSPLLSGPSLQQPCLSAWFENKEGFEYEDHGGWEDEQSAMTYAGRDYYNGDGTAGSDSIWASDIDGICASDSMGQPYECWV